MMPQMNKSPMMMPPADDKMKGPKVAVVAEVEKDKPGQPEFQSPEGFEVPEGTEPGAEFQAVATVRISEDGTLTLVALDGAKFPDAADVAMDEEKPDVEEESEEVVESPEGGDIASFQDEIEQQQKKMKG